MADRPPRVPRWVKLSGVALIALALLVVGLMLLTGRDVDHGPGQHRPHGSGPTVQAEREHR